MHRNDLPRSVPTYSLYGELPAAPRDEPLHCESIAARSRLHDWEIDAHRHEALFQVLYVRSGGGHAVTDDARHALAPPCVLILPPLCVHGFRFTREVDGVVLTVADAHLQAILADAPGLHRRFGAPALHRLSDDPDAAAAVDALLRSFVEEFQGAAAWRAASLRALLLRLMVRLARLAEDADTGPVAGMQRKLRHIQRFRALVDRDYRARRPVGAYADALGITATQLNRLCRELLGRSVLEVIDARILLEAERDLLYTTLGIKEVALSLGFSDAAYFTRFFAKRTGRTPTAFREAGRRRLAPATPPGGQRNT